MTGPRRTREGLPLHDRALRLLAVRPRSRAELRIRLLRAGFELGEVEAELARLEAVGLVDDERFAEAYTEHAIVHRLDGRRKVAAGLAAKGVDRQVIERTLEGMEDDRERAVELARQQLRRLPPLGGQVIFRRLMGFLTRHGYTGEVARSAVRVALGIDPPEEG